MAKKIVHQIIDDIDGSVLEVGEGETVLFSLDGVAYEIDLSDDNAASLRAAVAPFISAGRRLARNATPTSTSASKRTAGRHDLAAVRAWAKDNGHAVSERGRVPRSLLEAYDAAH